MATNDNATQAPIDNCVPVPGRNNDEDAQEQQIEALLLELKWLWLKNNRTSALSKFRITNLNQPQYMFEEQMNGLGDCVDFLA